MTYQQIVYNQDSRLAPLDWVKLFDVILTDPPYSEHVHAKAVSHSGPKGTRKRELGFDHLQEDDLEHLANCAASVRRWSIVYNDEVGAQEIRKAALAKGVEYVRALPWVRWSMPQMSGDRPPTGFETLVCLHPKGKKHWNGPGNLTHFAHLALRGEEKHKCEKPLDQALDLVSFFSDIGESVLDLYAGHGTIGVACRLLGRHYAGFEINPIWQEKANARIAGNISSGDMDRIIRWLEKDSEPVASLSEGPSLIRAAKRAQDKENVRKGVFL